MTTAVFVCRRCKGHKALAAVLADCPGVHVREVGCQKVCTRAVVGVRHPGGLLWLQRIDTGKRRRALCQYVTDGGPVPKRLRKLLVAKRTNRLRP